MDLKQEHEFMHVLNQMDQPDYELYRSLTGMRPPSLIIAPDGHAYLYRWHLIPRSNQGNCYFHVQCASDPERPLHDHPYQNTSVILAGGYDEIIDFQPLHFLTGRITRQLRKGDVVHRQASEAHRLIMPEGISYSMSLFTTGPRVREWGFWTKNGWVNEREMTQMENGQSVIKREYRDEKAD